MESSLPVIGTHILMSPLFKTPLGEVFAAKDKHGVNVLATLINPQVASGQNFIVRYELMRQILPRIKNDYLLQVREVGQEENLFYQITESPKSETGALLRLCDLTFSSPREKEVLLSQILSQLVTGIQALQEVRNPLYQNGMLPDLLNPETIYITDEQEPKAKIGHFCDFFLMFGESKTSPLQYAFLEGDAAPFSRSLSEFFEDQNLLSPQTRQGKKFTLNQTLFNLGALFYYLLTGRYAKGVYPLTREGNPSFEPLWDEIVKQCFRAQTGRGYPSLKALTADVQKLADKIREKYKGKKTLFDIPPPEGMALIFFDEKVVLGTSDGPFREQPSFKARLDPFYLDTHPITVAQFQEFMPAYEPSTYSKGQHHPATNVSFNLAQAYCNWRSEQEGLPEGTYRLPTEYEWEAACRGGTSLLYPWGDKFDPRYIHCGEADYSGAEEVFARPPGKFKLYCMLGNIWEWTESTFAPHPFSDYKDPLYTVKRNVIKGGCWFTEPLECRATLRDGLSTYAKRPYVGFRCARDAVLE